MRLWGLSIALVGLAALFSACGGSGPDAAATVANADRSATFKLRADSATSVIVSGDVGTLAMAKDSQGTWSVRSAVLEPAIYRYFFEVDGVKIAESLLTVPGDPPMPWEKQDIPPGQFSKRSYHSELFASERSYVVYTPPGYGAGSEELPVLYLLHGYGNDELSWTAIGKADLIADSLLADGRIKPLLIVMPYGQPRPESPYEEAFDPAFQEKFARQILDEIMPAVEKDFRASADPRRRAIAGVSMGGMQAAYIGLNHPGSFASLGIWSPAIFEDPAVLLSGLASAPEKLKRSFSRIELAVGQQDDLNLLPRSEALDAFLTAQGVAHDYRPGPGTHSWLLWRGYLIDFLATFSANAP